MKNKILVVMGAVTILLVLLVIGGTALSDSSQVRPARRWRVAQANAVWSSGWVEIAPGETKVFTHSLGGDPALYTVDLWFRDTQSPGFGIHHRAYGGMDVAGQRYGVHWQNLTSTSISVVRQPDDVAAAQVFLRIWVPDPPDYDSGWVNIQPGQLITLTHNLGGDVDDYTVGMKFQDTTPGGLGIHQYAFGGLEAGGQYQGAAWQNLTDTAIQVQRFGADATVHQVRVFITLPDPPDYDSGWVGVAQGETRTFTHDLGGHPNGYVVRVSVRSAAAGINTRMAGGLEAGGHFYGANWQKLTDSAISVFRRPHDASAEQVRVRIWAAEVGPTGPWQSWTNANYVSKRSLALQDGVLWAGTEGGVVRWNPTTGSYTKYLAPDGLGDGDVRAVAPDTSGVTWLGTYGGGLAAFDGAEWTTFTATDGLSSDFVRAIAFQDGLKWVGTSYGLNAFDDGSTPSDKSDDTWTIFRTQDGLSDNDVYDLAMDSQGRLWMATYGGGLSVLDDGGTPHDKADDLWGTFSEGDGLVYNYMQAIVVDQEDRVWAGTLNGLSVLNFAGTPFDKADDTWATFTPADGLTDDDVYDLAVDSQGRLWMATWGGGIFVLDHGGTPFDKSDDTWTQFTSNDGLVYNWLYALALDEATGQVWAGSWGYGISRLDYAGTVEDKSDDTWTTFVTDDPLPDNTVYALLAEGDHIWIATYCGGLTATDGETWTTFAFADGLASTCVYAIASQSEPKWIGTSSGLNAFDDGGTPHDKSDDTWTTFRTEDGLSKNNLRAVTLDGSGRKWLGTWGGGLNVLDDGGTPHDKSDDTWAVFTTTDGLANDSIYSVAVDGSERVWVGTYDGLSVLDFAGTPFDKSDDAWMTFTTADGLASHYVYSVAADRDGRVWAGTSNGLNVLDHGGTPFDKSDDIWTQFSTGDGLAGYVVQDISFDAMGRLWLATSGGLSVLDMAGTPHDKSDDEWLSWRVADGLADSSLRCVAIDRSGAVWVGTETGLSRMIGAQYRLYLPLVTKS